MIVDRIESGFDPFVIPFVAGMIFVLSWCLVGMVRLYCQLPMKDRQKFLISLINPKIIWKNVRDIFLNCLIHVKLWQRNKVLGYMHSSIAFGWFMLILLGHLEVFLFLPNRIRFFYYPVFFNFFVAKADDTIQGALLFFLMDFFLLMVLSGIGIAIVKRVRSRVVGMRRTTVPTFFNLVGLYTLWAIFPLRLLAEGFTAHISGGSFLTIPLNWVFRQFLGNDMNMLPTWWAYSISLGLFMFVLPFTRYMHIPAEMLLIPMRNAGLQVRHSRRGFARVEIISCPGCGVCIDACPMSVQKSNLKFCTVYFNRNVRRGNARMIEQISDKCLLCGKCEAVCPVGVEGHRLRVLERAARRYAINPEFLAIRADALETGLQRGKVLYFSGCMTSLTPRIGKAVISVLDKAGVDYEWIDRDGGLCCGRPLLTAGRFAQASNLIAKNERMILSSGADTLLLSCPICYRIFREHYSLPGIRIVHHSVYFNEIIRQGLLKVDATGEKVCYHDPCELGRGSGIYDEPRELLGSAVELVSAGHSGKESICCGGSLGSLTLTFAQREVIARNSIKDLYVGNPDRIATACPLCLHTFSRYSDRPVEDIAEIIDKHSV